MSNLIIKIQSLGISKREAEVYLALLQKKELLAPEIAKITSVSRSKTYEILQNLVKKKLCTENFKNGLKVFSAIEPHIAIENILSIYDEEVNNKRKFAKEFVDDLMNIYKKSKHVDYPIDYIEVINDIGQVKDRWINIQNNSKNEILAFVKPPYSTGTLGDNVDTESNVAKKSITLRAIYEYQSIKSKEEINQFIKVIESYQKLGEEIRLTNELPMKLVVSDETVTMFSLVDRIGLKRSLTTMILNHPHYAKAIKIIFESYWNSGITLEEYEKTKLKSEKCILPKKHKNKKI